MKLGERSCGRWLAGWRESPCAEHALCSTSRPITAACAGSAINYSGPHPTSATDILEGQMVSHGTFR